jgi:hypothetical protein
VTAAVVAFLVMGAFAVGFLCCACFVVGAGAMSRRVADAEMLRQLEAAARMLQMVYHVLAQDLQAHMPQPSEQAEPARQVTESDSAPTAEGGAHRVQAQPAATDPVMSQQMLGGLPGDARGFSENPEVLRDAHVDVRR